MAEPVPIDPEVLQRFEKARRLNAIPKAERTAARRAKRVDALMRKLEYPEALRGHVEETYDRLNGKPPDMTERLYTLHEITGVMGEALASMRMRGEIVVTPRELDRFMDEVVGRLKSLAAQQPPKGLGDAIASPND